MPDLKAIIFVVLLLAVGLLTAPGDLLSGGSSATTADAQAYWFGRYNFVDLVVLSGMGPPLTPTPQMMQDMAPMAGLDPQDASMAGMTMVSGVYASGDPHLPQTPNPHDMTTMRWDDNMDKTFTPAAQGYTLLKLTAEQFHLDYHDTPADRFAAIMMIPEAKAIVKLLAKMHTESGAFARLGPDGKPLLDKATSQDQIAALWGLSSFFLRATDPANDYFARTYRQFVGMGQMQNQMQMSPGMVMNLPVDDVDALDLMNQAFQTVHGLLDQPLSAADQALATEALGWFTVASDASKNQLNHTLSQLAQQDLRILADRLTMAEKPTLADRALSVYGLMEASRITGNQLYAQAALQAFRQLELLWDTQAGVYATREGISQYVYDPFTVGAVLAGLNALRLFGPSETARRATQCFSAFFEHAVIRSGLMQVTGFPMMVPEPYRERQPAAVFTDPHLQTPKESGKAPVYAGEVAYVAGSWRVTDEHFNTAQAMFLADMSVLPHGAKTDGFIPLYRLNAKM